MKRCPFCAEEIQDQAIKCRHCGSWLASPDLPHPEPEAEPRPQRTADAPRPGPEPSYAPQPPITPPQHYQHTPGAPKLIMPKASPDDPVIMGLISGCCIAGLGQILVGQTTKGVALLVGNIALAAMTMGFSAFVTWPLMGIDAYMVARRLKEGKAVGEWEFFPSAD